MQDEAGNIFIFDKDFKPIVLSKNLLDERKASEVIDGGKNRYFYFDIGNGLQLEIGQQRLSIVDTKTKNKGYFKREYIIKGTGSDEEILQTAKLYKDDFFLKALQIMRNYLHF